MRTTININEQILAIAKQKAADRKTTLGAIIEDALRKAFSEKKEVICTFDFSGRIRRKAWGRS